MSIGSSVKSQSSTTGSAAVDRSLRVPGVCATPTRITPSGRRPSSAAMIASSPSALVLRVAKDEVIAKRRNCLLNLVQHLGKKRVPQCWDHRRDNACSIRSQALRHEIRRVANRLDCIKHSGSHGFGQEFRPAQCSRNGHRRHAGMGGDIFNADTPGTAAATHRGTFHGTVLLPQGSLHSLEAGGIVLIIVKYMEMQAASY